MISSFQGPYRFLSNFYPSYVEFEGTIYPTVEHAFQAAKTINEFERQDILRQDSPGRAKRKGRIVNLRPDWERVKLGIMEELVRKKFEDPELKEKLLATGNQQLVEGNWWGDTFWGVCNGRGSNHLGKILMKVRSELV